MAVYGRVAANDFASALAGVARALALRLLPLRDVDDRVHQLLPCQGGWADILASAGGRLAGAFTFQRASERSSRMASPLRTRTPRRSAPSALSVLRQSRARNG
jgi:hypothetical protein